MKTDEFVNNTISFLSLLDPIFEGFIILSLISGGGYLLYKVLQFIYKHFKEICHERHFKN